MARTRRQTSLAVASLFMASVALSVNVAPVPAPALSLSSLAPAAAPVRIAVADQTARTPLAAATPTLSPSAKPTATAMPTTASTLVPGTTTASGLASLVGLVPTPTGSPTATANPGDWRFNMFDPRAERWQDPDLTACTATAAMSMLNTISFSGTDPGLVWVPSLSYSKQESILAYERAHMTMRKYSPGSDPHGWRNALNFFGWGSIDADVYRDAAYQSLDAAGKAVVSAIAIYHKPVGVLSQWGSHAEFVTGYRVVGDDPSTGSLNFRVVGVYITDPWRQARYRNEYVSYVRWHSGYTWLRFGPYLQADSPYRDPIDGQIGKREWLGKFVIVKPVK